MLEMYELQIAVSAISVSIILLGLALGRLWRLLRDVLAGEGQDDRTFGTGEED